MASIFPESAELDANPVMSTLRAFAPLRAKGLDTDNVPCLLERACVSSVDEAYGASAVDKLA